MTDRHQSAQHRIANQATAARPLWHIYIGITGLLLLIIVALAGGIIWYNSKKSNEPGDCRRRAAHSGGGWGNLGADQINL